MADVTLTPDAPDAGGVSSSRQVPTGLAPTATFTRSVFETSRLMEFFSERELVMQLGFPRSQWAVALLKELLDNALDECENAGIPPDIRVTLAADRLSVEDNGTGLPAAILQRSLDYRVRVSSKSYYASPTRGQLGNALKCLWAASYVVDGTRGCVDVETGGKTYQIRVALEPFTQRPDITCAIVGESVVKSGTKITAHWPQIASSLDSATSLSFYNVRDLLQRYAILNPSATLRYTTPTGTETCYGRTHAAWQHWLPSRPTSAHWYTLDRFQALLTAYIGSDMQHKQVRTVRELVAEFDGLRGTSNQQTVTHEAGLSGAALTALVQDGALDPGRVQALLAAMQKHAKPVKPARLGVLGQTHLQTALIQHLGVDAGTSKYKRCEGEDAGAPYVLEVAFGAYDHAHADGRRVQVLGTNWSPALGTPFETLYGMLSEAMVDESDPVALVVHLACPRVTVVDRGKTRVEIPAAINAALAEAVQVVTKAWTRQKRTAIREGQARARMLESLWRKSQEPVISAKAAAWSVMEEAYMKASGQGRYPANARQIMYAARPLIIALTGKATPWADSSYFTQTLLTAFIEAHPDLTATWDVVFDARGHFREPHTGRQFGLGTLEVRDYIKQWHATIREDVAPPEFRHAIPTSGPAHRYRYALFVEKEGFNPLLEQNRIAETYDLVLMSTKGMTVIAARQLVEALTLQGVTILVLHDFDKSGFEILHKFTANTRRHTYKTPPKVIDLGLRLDDAQDMGLESERVVYKKTKIDPRRSLQRCGATEEECAFLVQHGNRWDGWEGQRIELNSMTSAQFLRWLRDRLDAVGVEKFLPDVATLKRAFRRQWKQMGVQEAIERAMTTPEPLTAIPIPDTLEDAVRDALLIASEAPWDEALWEIVAEAFDTQRNGTDADDDTH